jgi:hypothetical protein
MMKRKVIRIIAVLVFLPVPIMSAAYLYVANSWRSAERVKIVKFVAAKVQESQPLPDSLLNIYNAVYPFRMGKGMHSDISDRIWNGVVKDKTGRNLCYCDDIIYNVRIFFSEKLFPLTRLEAIILGFGLEENVGSEACLSYFIRLTYDELQPVRSLYSWHNKKLDSLTVEEFKEFLVLEKAPVYFDKFKHPDRFAARLNALNGRLQENGFSGN